MKIINNLYRHAKPRNDNYFTVLSALSVLFILLNLCLIAIL